MAEQNSYSIYTTGELLEGFERENVLAAFSSVFKISEEKAEKFVDARKLVKKNLTEPDAKKYQQHLNKIGVATDVQQASNDRASTTSVAATSPTPVQTLKPKLALDPVNIPAPHASPVPAVATNGTNVNQVNTEAGEHSFSCPKCRKPQLESQQCTGCGIFFEKFHQARQQTENGSGIQSQRHGSNTFNKAVDEDSEDISIVTIALVIAVAVAGAYLWKMIGVGMGRELGAVAWAIGGAIGAAAAFSGARGDLTGAACAVFTLLAIFFGKYMIVTNMLDEVEMALSGEGPGGYLEELYDESNSEKAVFAKISKDDASIKEFMVEHDYTDARYAGGVSHDELQEFKDYTQPWLEDTEDMDASWNEFLEETPDMAAAFEEVSPTSLVFESLGPLDLLFAFLGVSSAFGLGRNGFNRG